MDRTIDCCRDALAARASGPESGLADIDYVILVGGSSRVPLVRETVRSRLLQPRPAGTRPHSRSAAARAGFVRGLWRGLRAAGHGTRYLFPQESGVRGQESGELDCT